MYQQWRRCCARVSAPRQSCNFVRYGARPHPESSTAEFDQVPLAVHLPL